MVLTVVIHNVTFLPIRLGTAGVDMASFCLSLVGPTRQITGPLSGWGEPAAVAVPLLAAGHDLLDTLSREGTALVLPPGEKRQYRLVLSHLADLTVAGNYTARIARVLPSGAVVAAPVLHVLLDGPYDGISQGGQELDVY